MISWSPDPCPQLRHLSVGLPRFRGFQLRNNPDYPATAAWFAAISSRPAYQRVCSDDQTLQLLFQRMMGLSPAASTAATAASGASAADAAAAAAAAFASQDSDDDASSSSSAAADAAACTEAYDPVPYTPLTLPTNSEVCTTEGDGA